MPSRPSRRSRRAAIPAAAPRTTTFDSLESRVLMSAAPTVAKTLSATVKPLQTLTSLSKAVRTAVTQASGNLFHATSSLAKAANGVTQHIAALSVTPFTLDMAGLQSVLAAAPAEFTPGASDIPVVLAVPMPDGTLSRFKIVRSEVMDPALARQFPSIRTYRGIGIDDPTADIRLDTTQFGFHAQVLSTHGASYIDPYFLNDANGTYISYYRSDATQTDPWTCSVVSAAKVPVKEANAASALESAEANGTFLAPSITFGGTLKTYRAAVGASYQYTAAVGGGTVAGGQAAIVTAINRVTGVYESELGIRMVLIANNSSLVYATSTGSFSNGTSVINTSTAKISGIVGVSNYDFGHVFTTGSGGISELGVVGIDSDKGASTTGLPNPTGDAFYIDYVAHEMGHEFGANHTFNTAKDTSNRNAGTAYEPGSGISIMAYASLEGTDNLAAHSIPYFHSAGIDEIRADIVNKIPNVGVATATGDAPPTVNAGLDYTIPASTPFGLTAVGSDPDGDVLTYDWQERDKGAATNLSTADNGASPLFTEIAPTSNPTRNLPTLNSILGGFLNTVAGGTTAAAANVLGAGTNTATANDAERMYSVARNASNWRVTVRDNRGGLTTDDMVLKVVNTGAAFAITNLNTAATLLGGSAQTITWNVAGTTANGINAANVNILLSTDGGNTFTTTLASGVANDGSEVVQLPYALGTTTARIKIQPTNNIFFDINNANFTITNVAVPSSTVPGVPVLAAASDSGSSDSDGITNFNNASAETALTFSVTGTVPGALVELLADGAVSGSVTATGTTTLISTNALPAGTQTLADGVHNFTVRQTESGKPVSTASAATAVTIDTAPPTLVPLADRFGFETAQTLTYQFADAATDSITPGDVTVESPSDSTTPAAVTYDPATGIAVFTFDAILPDGNYTATLSPGVVSDVAGNKLAATEATTFFVLAGDADRDGTVDFDDLVTLSQNYNSSGRTFSQGNFNYSSDGLVDFDDLVILSQQYNKSVLAKPAGLTLAPPAKLKGRQPSIASGILA